MLELTKKQTTAGLTELTFVVPNAEAKGLELALKDLLHAIGYVVKGDDPNASTLYPAAELFPDASPAKALRGLRAREDMTQAEMAARLGLMQHHISEMEIGKRVISLDMAKRIGAAFNMSHKVFL